MLADNEKKRYHRQMIIPGWGDEGQKKLKQTCIGVVGAGGLGSTVLMQLAVAGFDGTRVAQMTHPPLTTVRVPMFDMGAAAVRLLCDRLSDPERPQQHITLKSELVVRQSCGASLLALERTHCCRGRHLPGVTQESP